MAEQSNALFTISQLALALIGFSGIVIALGHRQLGKLSRGEKLQLTDWSASNCLDLQLCSCGIGFLY
jgi:hypothetical protein